MSQKVYPERQRCAACRKKLEKVVLDGLYCSYTCARIRVPSKKVENAPRHCQREVNGTWDFKTRFRSKEEVPQKLRHDPATNIYHCDYCRYLHVGHSRPKEFDREKLHRTVASTETLGSVIKRTREAKNIEIRMLAKRLKVPAVRIREIEEGNPAMRADVLMQVMVALRLQMVIQEK